MTSFKVSLDRIEGDIAVLLVRDEETIKQDIPLSFLPESQKKGIVWISQFKRIRRKQRIPRKEWHLQ